MRWKLVKNFEDIEKLVNSSLQPHQRQIALLELAEKGGEYGYMLLFMCIHETSEVSAGHEDAAKILQEKGM